MNNILDLIKKSNKKLGLDMNVHDTTFDVSITEHVASFSVIDKSIVPTNLAKMLRESPVSLGWKHQNEDEYMIASWFHATPGTNKVCTTMFVADKNTSKDYDGVRDTAKKIAKGEFKGSKGVWYLIKSIGFDDLKAPYE